MVFENDGKAIFTVFIGAIIAAVFIASIATSVIGQTQTQTTVDFSFTSGSAINTTTEILGRDIISTAALVNASGDNVLANFTIAQDSGADGLLAVLIRPNDDGGAIQLDQLITINYTYVPDGYLNNAGARSINNLIIIIAALAIVVFVIVVFVGKGSLGKLMDSGIKNLGR